MLHVSLNFMRFLLLLQLFKVPLHSSLSPTASIMHPVTLTTELAEGAFHPIFQDINENVELDQPQHWALRNTNGN